MDIADQSERVAEGFLQAAINNKRPEAPGYTGFCFHCDNDLEAPKRWCDADCRTAWERETGRRDGSK